MACLSRNAPRNARPLLLSALAAVAFISGPAGGRAEAAASGPFLAHQALYELRLVKSRGSNAINSVRGRILYSFSGSACEGYTSEFRQVSELDSGEGKVTLSDLRSTSWEDGAGKSYRFMRCRSNCSRTVSRGPWCSTTMILSFPARWESSTSGTRSRVISSRHPEERALARVSKGDGEILPAHPSRLARARASG